MLLSGQHYQWPVNGSFLSIKLSVLAFMLALPPVITIALLRLTPVTLPRSIGQTYTETIRNVPLLAHMLFWYFGTPQILSEFIRDWFYSMSYETASAVIALALYTAAYMMEDVRSGVRSIPKEQLEASRMLRLSFLQAMRLMVLSRLLHVTIPPLVGQILNLWKNSNIAMVIGVTELMYQTQQVESTTFRGFKAFAFTTAAYLAISIAIMVFSA